MSFTPKAAQLAEQVSVYVTGAKSIVKASLAAAHRSAAFADIYHISLSTDAVLRASRAPNCSPG